MNFLVLSYTCCSDRHASPYWTFICRWISMGFTPSLLKKNWRQNALLSGACVKRGRHLYTTTSPSCCIPASYCHLSATLHTMSIIIVNLQDKRAVVWIFIALLRFSFESPSYISKLITLDHTLLSLNPDTVNVTTLTRADCQHLLLDYRLVVEVYDKTLYQTVQLPSRHP
jgi:hypothetical protein